jgi:hypothetical protein
LGRTTLLILTHCVVSSLTEHLGSAASFTHFLEDFIQLLF